MAAATINNKRYAVVSGGNKGIGFGICKQLASHGITVILTARDEKKGLDALEKLKEFPFSDNLLFHQLDVSDSSSVASLAEFVRVQFGKLDILINNAGVTGGIVDPEGIRAAVSGAQVNWKEIVYQNYELMEEGLQTNYYGAKKMVEAFVPLLQLSQSPRIVNVSSSMGQLKNVPGEWIRDILNDEKNLTEERVDDLLNQFLKDFKEGCSFEDKGWPPSYSAYKMSKVAMNAYTRILAKKYPDFKVNCVCPGFVKTDINFNTGRLTVEEGAASVVRLALLPDDGPSGLFFYRQEVSSF